MDTTVSELREDIKELQGFMDTAQRQKVRDILTIEIKKLETDISHRIDRARQKEAISGGHDVSANPPINTGHVHHARVPKEITTYAWDQSDKFMKIYIDAPGVQSLPGDKVVPEFMPSAFKVKLMDFNGADHFVSVVNLHGDIVPGESYHKVKNGKVLVMLKKALVGNTWPFVTKKKKEEKKPSTVDDTADPSNALMDMMKKMYDEGDDEMKRTITKAWVESREKQSAGAGMPPY